MSRQESAPAARFPATAAGLGLGLRLGLGLGLHFWLQLKQS